MPKHTIDQESAFKDHAMSQPNSDETVVDINKVSMPKLSFSSMALSQYQLIVENDFTLKGKYLRVLISGKGCDGFTYSVGFTDWHQEDLKVPVLDAEGTPVSDAIEVLMDPFTAFYLQQVAIDYLQDFANNNEGFTVTNLNQKEFAGKFWRQEAGQSKVPPLKEDLGL